MSIDLVGHQAADLVLSEVEDIANSASMRPPSFSAACTAPSATTTSSSSMGRVNWISGRPGIVLDRPVDGGPAAEREVRGHLPRDVIGQAAEDHLVIPGPESLDVALDKALLDRGG